MHFDLSDAYRPRASFVHRLDPRTKVLCALLAIAALGVIPAGRWALFLVMGALIVGVAAGSRLGAGFAMKRAAMALPFVLAALPLPFTTSGRTVFEVPLVGWAASDEGLTRLASLLVRTWLAAQAAILLTATTPFRDLLWALGALRLPRILVSTIGFMYRYLFVLADEAARMLQARSSRAARLGKKRPSLRWLGWTVGMMVGTLFLRSLERSDRVYAAMLSRGYDGRPLVFVQSEMRRADWWALLTTGLILAVLVVIPHLA